MGLYEKVSQKKFCGSERSAAPELQFSWRRPRFHSSTATTTTATTSNSNKTPGDEFNLELLRLFESTCSVSRAERPSGRMRRPQERVCGP